MLRPQQKATDSADSRLTASARAPSRSSDRFLPLGSIWPIGQGIGADDSPTIGTSPRRAHSTTVPEENFGVLYLFSSRGGFKGMVWLWALGAVFRSRSRSPDRPSIGIAEEGEGSPVERMSERLIALQFHSLELVGHLLLSLAASQNTAGV
jgi:hypothetical protein